MSKVTVVIVVDEHGHMTIDAAGPLRGRDGMLTLLDEARKLAEQMKP